MKARLTPDNKLRLLVAVIFVVIIGLTVWALSGNKGDAPQPEEPMKSPTASEATLDDLPDFMTEDGGIKVVKGVVVDHKESPDFSGNVFAFFFDYDCSWCIKFEQTAEWDTFESTITEGEDTALFYPLAFLDKDDEDKYSTQAANASITVAAHEKDKWLAFHKALTESGGKSDDIAKQLADAAKSVGVSQETVDKFAEGTYVKLLPLITAKAFENIEGTPSLFINGTNVPLFGDSNAVEEVLKVAVPPSLATPIPTE